VNMAMSRLRTRVDGEANSRHTKSPRMPKPLHSGCCYAQPPLLNHG
jgi:hypothetical protein